MGIAIVGKSVVDKSTFDGWSKHSRRTHHTKTNSRKKHQSAPGMRHMSGEGGRGPVMRFGGGTRLDGPRDHFVSIQ